MNHPIAPVPHCCQVYKLGRPMPRTIWRRLFTPYGRWA